MRTLVLVGLASAAVGGVAGAAVALVATSGAPKHASSRAKATPSDDSTPASDATLEERLANVEQAVRVLERRRAPLSMLGAPADAGAPGATPRPGNAPEPAPALVDDPVFEAAVRDVIERAEADRETERDLRRDDRRKQTAARWVDDLGPKLHLNDEQKSKLLEIGQQFMGDLGRLWENDGGAGLPRATRRGEVQKLREQAEQKLRDVLDPTQVRTYDGLSDDEKLGFPRRRGGDSGARTPFGP